MNTFYIARFVWLHYYRTVNIGLIEGDSVSFKFQFKKNIFRTDLIIWRLAVVVNSSLDIVKLESKTE